MRGCRWGIVIIALTTVLGAACAPRQIKPVAATDPAPLLNAVRMRESTLDRGLSGTLELAYKNGRERFKGSVYIVAYPDGRFRLEVPAPLGGTFLVMTSDSKEILAFYPGRNRAFRSEVDGRSINPYLPFPLPLDPGVLPALIMGVLPAEDTAVKAQAWLMDSGEKLLRVIPDGKDLQFDYLFDAELKERIRKITARGRDLQVSLRIGPGPDQLPADFELLLPEGTLSGQWDSVAPFTGEKASLVLRIPDSVTITDLEALP